MNEKRDPEYLDVEVWDDEEVDCAVCGDEIETGDEFAWEPWEPGSKMVVTSHPGCVIRNGYKLRWPT